MKSKIELYAKNFSVGSSIFQKLDIETCELACYNQYSFFIEPRGKYR